MNELEQSFRSAVMGGFNRQDVLNYIETSAKTAAEQMEALQKERDQLRKTGEDTDAARREAEGKAEALDKENQRQGAELSEKAAALETAETALGQAQAELEALQAQLRGVKEKATKLESAAAAYEDLKDRAGSIELDAHQRAMVIEHEAQEKAKKVRADAEQLIYRVQAGYDRLRADVGAGMSHASGELARVNKTLDGIKAEFNEHDTALKKLLATCQEGTGPKAPKPLAVNGEA